MSQQDTTESVTERLFNMVDRHLDEALQLLRDCPSVYAKMRTKSGWWRRKTELLEKMGIRTMRADQCVPQCDVCHKNEATISTLHKQLCPECYDFIEEHGAALGGIWIDSGVRVGLPALTDAERAKMNSIPTDIVDRLWNGDREATI